MFSLALQNLFIVMESHLFILSLTSLVQRDISVSENIAVWDIWDFAANDLL